MLLKPIDLALVEDHALFRKTLKNFLLAQDRINVTIQAPNISDLLNKLKTASADVLLMDIFLPELIGTDVLRAIRSEYSTLKIILLSMSTDMNLISSLLDAGIHGYISKADEPEELLLAIRAVAEDRIYRNRIFTEALYWNKQNHIKGAIEKPIVHFSDRERKMLQLIWAEKTNKEIADELLLGVRSVEKIRQDMKEKIGVKSTVGLLKYAIHHRIIGINVRENLPII
ncbi:MAG TPA: response regulator transcription factor [Puia sp.]|nr:response regulator transcription factor [Puia sp.]